MKVPEALFFLCFFILISVFLSIPILHTPFFYGDDVFRIVFNVPYLKNGLADMLSHGTTSVGYLSTPERPVTNISLWFNYHFFGPNPFSWRLINSILHALTAFMLYLVLSRFFVRSWACIGSVLFLCHPVLTSTVFIVTQRSEILTTFFGLVAFYFFIEFIKKRNIIFYIGIFIALVFSMLSKGSGVAFIFILMLYAVLENKGRIKKDLLPYLSGFIIFPIIVLYVRVSNTLHPQPPLGDSFSFFEKQILVISHFLKIFIWPYPLHVKYDNTDFFPSIRTWISAAGLLTLIGGGLVLFRKHSYVVFGILSVLLAFIPEFSFFPIPQVFEYRAYIPYVFLTFTFISIASLSQIEKFCKVLFVGIILLFAFMTYSRYQSLSTEDHWWSTSLTQDHINNKGHNNMGLMFLIYDHHILEAQIAADHLAKAFPDEPWYFYLKLILKNCLSDPPNAKNVERLVTQFARQNADSGKPIHFMINRIVGMIAKNYFPKEEACLILHKLIFPHLSTLRQNPDSKLVAAGYPRLLMRLKQIYEEKPTLTEEEELNYNSVLAAIEIMRMPADEPFQTHLEKLYRINPNWQIFFK